MRVSLRNASASTSHDHHEQVTITQQVDLSSSFAAAADMPFGQTMQTNYVHKRN